MNINKCPICGGEVVNKFQLGFRNLLGSDTNKYVQMVSLCRHCDFIFTSNPFTQKQLENRYKKMSKFEYDSSSYVLDNDYQKQSVRQKHFLLENIDFSAVHSILEVGASSGYNLSLYKDECKRIVGIEPSALNCRLCRQNYDIELFQGMFQEYLELHSNEQFDLVFLSMILEHIVNPFQFVQQLGAFCPKYFFIEVPTLDIRHREEPMGIFAEEHVNLFTLDSLSELMTRLGYSLVNVENIYGIKRYLPAGFPAIATIWEKIDKKGHKQRYNLFSAEECLDKYIADSKNGLNLLKEKIHAIPNDMNLALWGVGHHVSMLLANTELGEKHIVRVYDSDERKHGIPFAGVAISPFQKKDIEDGSVEGILLTTYTAQKAIMRFIEKQQLECKIITLYDI